MRNITDSDKRGRKMMTQRLEVVREIEKKKE